MAEDDLPVEEATVVDPAPVHTLDAHMAPYLARLGQIGTVSMADLRGFYSALRSALLAHLQNPVHEEPVVEEHDVATEEAQARRDASRNANEGLGPQDAKPEEAKLFS